MSNVVKFLLQESELSAENDESIFDAARRVNIDLGGVCGGRGFCGKCQVITSGDVSPITHVEREVLSEGQLKNNIRLACQASVLGNVSVSSIYVANLQVATMGYEPEFALDPAVKIRKIDGELRIIYSTGSDDQVLEYLGIEQADTCRIFGLAVDIGTTKIVIYALDLKDGHVLATYMSENPQVVFGADVMSRLARAVNHGAKEQQRMVVDFINEAVKKLERNGLDASRIYEVVVVGNSVMHHLFLDQDITNLSHSPYRVSLNTPKYLNSGDLLIKSANAARVYAPPVVEGFVGSDALVGAYLLKLGSEKGTSIFIDLGTNSEIMVAHKGSIIAASTPAGPAFEGMNIRHGMKSAPGAIESIAIEPRTLNPVVKTIGNKRPCGIAGSGLVDGVSEMLKAGIIDYKGKFRALDWPNIITGTDGPEYVLSRETRKKDLVSINQRDVRELQLAKAAIQAAVHILMKKAKVEIRQISRVYVAGSFGLYINPVSGINIGLFPEVRPEQIITVGNTAGAGARILLKNVNARREVEKLSRSIETVDLVREADFNRTFINSTYFPSGYIENYPHTILKLSGILGKPKFKLT